MVSKEETINDHLFMIVKGKVSVYRNIGEKKDDTDLEILKSNEDDRRFPFFCKEMKLG